MSNIHHGTSGAERFEEIYQHLRSREQRIYSAVQIAHLPDIESAHVHSGEWSLRKQSCQRLLNILKKKRSPLNILEVGCGNGWLSAQMAQIERSRVTGIDVNSEELEQAKTVFCHYQNLHFLHGNLQDAGLPNSPYDIIVFAATLQYFRSPKETLTAALSLLVSAGEIHILDTPFYKAAEAPLAAKRTADYYASVGVIEMIPHYFHHRIDDLSAFDYKVVYNPKSLFFKFGKQKNPFFHLSISALK